ncbi:xanthine dehydrogenase molybdopterin binding subunit [Vibrio mangrovi]|uniref:Xanthine dehydrogenase molybdenum-binding subunit n=1 Tax=Vibrio mangrovi TaxID=474394 RepID=A0A1Y6IWD3_9VIBR|nr:xanthine dehydrogenase molybdopterin binding subunit [Vibrio mangrovi]MDW6004504.1 xanthine dehydrogenase molybdopterin binding subunit [Vibrio mangrovi]SMS00792.1 Xanthine dehydrogenase molybdenum-binding subunit [Vibrio mangrovi]
MRKLISHPYTAQHLQSQKTLETVGQPFPHESAGKQVAGEALFVDDYPEPRGCLHGALITSDIAKGTMTHLDLSDVRQSPGVVRVITCHDIPGLNDIGTIHKGDPLLCQGEIRYFRQPIAFVIAETHQLACQAAQKALIEYEETSDPVISYQQASQRDHLLPPHQMGTSLQGQTPEDASLRGQSPEGTLRIQGDLAVGGQEHFYLESQISLAELTEDGGIFVRTSTQNPTEVQNLIAEVLGIPFNHVTVDMRRMGGGFGGKETQAAPWACLASLGTILTKKAVKFRLPRAIDMSTTGKRHPFFNRYALTATDDGEILSADIEVNGLCGHSADLSDAIVDRAMFHADNAYFLGDACITGNRLKTDTVSHTAFRGFGGPQGMIVIEKAMQDLGVTLRQDPLDLRLKNLYRPGKSVTPYGMEVEQTQELREVLTRLEASSDYRQRRQQIHEWNQNSPILKKGLALTPVKFGISFTATHLNQAGALIHIYTDGTVQVSHGGTEMGQGLHTKIQQIVAQTFGIPMDWILVTSTRTDKVPNTSPTAASSGADLNGMAAHNAAMTIKERLLDFATAHYCSQSHSSECLSSQSSSQSNFGRLSSQPSATQPEIKDGKLYYDSGEVDWATLIQQAYLNRVSLSSTGYYSTPKIGYDRTKANGRPFFYFAIGASCSEVMIDTLTGEMTVERVDILHDVGNSLNPAIDIGQIEGAYIQGLGWLTTEELIWNEHGHLLSNSPMNYKIPSICDYPKQMNITLYDVPNPEHSIYRSKAVGEPPFMHAISTWCAIYDAIAAISDHQMIPELDTPATGERILTACQQQYDWLEQGGQAPNQPAETIGNR